MFATSSYIKIYYYKIKELIRFGLKNYFSGVHHKKNNCESTTVIAKVQNVLKAARSHLFPSSLTLTVAGVAKKTKLRKGNGGWGDVRDHELCSNITFYPDLALP